MIEIKAPHDYSAHVGKTKIFLAGSIEMGVAEDWQKVIAEKLKNKDVIILNPRRDAWDSSWEQTIENPKFREQVEWELDALDAADHVLLYFSPGTKSPITLMELGIHAVKKPERVVVCCPEGFWRKGNVDVICARFGIRQVKTLQDLSEAV